MQAAVWRSQGWRGSLRRRYALTFVLLVSLPLLVYGLVSATLTYRQQRDALGAVQLAQADAAAVRIGQFLHEVDLQLGWLTALPWAEDSAQQRRLDALRVLRQTAAISDIVLLDGTGRERVAESRLELSRVDSRADRSASPAFSGARSNRNYRGDVTFRKGSEPFMTVAVAGPNAASGVAIAQVSLKYIWDVVSRIRIGAGGIVYVIDPAGRLIAHPDINLVLRNTDLSQVLQAFEAQPAGTAPARALPLLGTRGQPVLASSVVIASVGWRVVVEQSTQEADEPLRAAARGALWVAAGSLLFALAAALWAAWRLVKPLRELSVGAARFGAGQLSHRIALHSGDELQQLGERFNAMATELQTSYGSLERQVQERTQQLSEANRAKSRLLAAASHDLRQPLHALNLLVAQLRTEREPGERDRLVGRVEAAVASINGLFDGLLDVSKLDAGVVRPQLLAFPVQRILDRIDVAYASAARSKGLELRIRASSAWVCSDPVLLERILGNFVGNAVRYTRSGAVLVGCRRSGSGLRIGVWDTGIGIAPDKLERVFDEFYQGDTDGLARGDGLGLGLWIVARLAELLGHRVQVRSTLGRGSGFWVEVPEAAPLGTAPFESDLNTTDALRGRRVLVIDNDDQVLASTVGLLISWGCQVTGQKRSDIGSVDGDQAPEILLVDMHLDDGDDGVRAIGRLRNRFGSAIPALVMTGDVTGDARARAAAAGLPLVEKPVSALLLRTALTRLVQGA